MRPPGPPPPPEVPAHRLEQGPVSNRCGNDRQGMTLRELGQFVQDCYRRDLDPDTTTIHAPIIGLRDSRIRMLTARPEENP